MKNVIFLLLLLFSIGHLTAQEVVDCPVKNIDTRQETNNERSGLETCFDTGCDWHNPKTMLLKFHIIRDQDGNYNFGPGDENLLNAIVDKANEKLNNNQPPSNPGIPDQPVPPINFQFELAEISYYDQENWAYPNITYPSNSLDYVDVVFVEQEGDWYGDGCGDPS